MIFNFIKPSYLALLLLIPLVILLHFLMLKRKRSHALRFANFEAIARVKGVDLLSKNIVILILSVAIVFLLILSFTITRSFEQLAEASRMKSEFINIVSHQLRSPLTNIKWTFEILSSDVKADYQDNIWRLKDLKPGELSLGSKWL